MNMYKDSSKDDNFYPDSTEKLIGEEKVDVVVDLTSTDEGKKETHLRNTISWISRNKWTCGVAFLISCSIVTLVVSTYKLSDLSLEDKEISSMKKDIVQIKVQRKKFEDDITVLFVGHSRQNEDLDKSEKMLQNITVTFEELTKKINNLTTNFERQIKLHVDMTKKIDDVQTDKKKMFDEFKQKQINLKQNLNNMTKTQEGFRNDLTETRNGLQKDTEQTVKSLRIEFEPAINKLKADSRAIQDSHNKLRAIQQSLLETVSEIKNDMQT
ncbi:unnamed protein product [Mytilus coruscus]|uniref:Uncharacterized protein n=1 Tax=Mytilus coruscus TaxID=42192 RepID=A0A6J8E3A1_MYTCO|nr:unnamed protein product [Mytilus coruscus]